MLRTTPRSVELKQDGIHVFESRHAPGFEMESAEWNFEKLCFLRQGRCKLVTDEASASLGTDSVTLVPTGLRHKFEDVPSYPATLAVVCFRRETIDRIAPPGLGLQRLRVPIAKNGHSIGVGSSHHRQELNACLRRMVFEQTTARPGYETAIWGNFLQIFALLERILSDEMPDTRLSTTSENFRRSLSFLDENFTEPLGIEKLAGLAGVSYRHYTTMFRATKGMTVATYLNHLRVEFAKKRLLASGHIAFAALDAGFGDLSHFYRVFKSATGMTPAQFIHSNSNHADERDTPSR